MGCSQPKDRVAVGAWRTLPDRLWVLRAVACAVLLLFAVQPICASACAGDCDGSGQVTVNELMVGVQIALGSVPADDCPSFDRDEDGLVSIGEIVAAINVALAGCPATATPTPRGEPSPTESGATATPTTQAVNEAPAIARLGVYRTYPGYPMHLRLAASDPEGGPLHYQGSDLPDGATLDAATGAFDWTPRQEQLGPFHIPFSVTDEGDPPRSAVGRLVVQVSPLDACVAPRCDPAHGCEAALVSLDTDCCQGVPSVRLAEVEADCPEGRVLLIGRNSSGFGRLRDCDRLRFISFAQGGSAVRFNLAARCLAATVPVTLRARLETRDRVLVDIQQAVALQEGGTGYAEARSVALPVSGAMGVLDLEGREAELAVTLTDGDGAVASTRLRVVLTAGILPDLPET